MKRLSYKDKEGNKQPIGVFNVTPVAVSQETGDSKTEVMSQAAVTEELEKKSNNIEFVDSFNRDVINSKSKNINLTGNEGVYIEHLYSDENITELCIGIDKTYTATNKYVDNKINNLINYDQILLYKDKVELNGMVSVDLELNPKYDDIVYKKGEKIVFTVLGGSSVNKPIWSLKVNNKEYYINASTGGNTKVDIGKKYEFIMPEDARGSDIYLHIYSNSSGYKILIEDLVVFYKDIVLSDDVKYGIKSNTFQTISTDVDNIHANEYDTIEIKQGDGIIIGCWDNCISVEADTNVIATKEDLNNKVQDEISKQGYIKEILVSGEDRLSSPRTGEIEVEGRNGIWTSGESDNILVIEPDPNKLVTKDGGYIKNITGIITDSTTLIFDFASDFLMQGKGGVIHLTGNGRELYTELSIRTDGRIDADGYYSSSGLSVLSIDEELDGGYITFGEEFPHIDILSSKLTVSSITTFTHNITAPNITTIENKLEEVTEATDELKADFNSLLNDENLNDSFDTLKEVDTWIKNHEGEAANMLGGLNSINGKIDDLVAKGYSYKPGLVNTTESSVQLPMYKVTLYGVGPSVVDYNIPFPIATERQAGMMTAEDKKKLYTCTTLEECRKEIAEASTFLEGKIDKASSDLDTLSNTVSENIGNLYIPWFKIDIDRKEMFIIDDDGSEHTPVSIPDKGNLTIFYGEKGQDRISDAITKLKNHTYPTIIIPTALSDKPNINLIARCVHIGFDKDRTVFDYEVDSKFLTGQDSKLFISFTLNESEEGRVRIEVSMD